MRKLIILIFLGILIPINFSYSQSGENAQNEVKILLDQMEEKVDLEDFKSAFLLGEKALKIHGEKILVPDTLLSNIYTSLGNVSIDLGEFDEAKMYFEKCLELRLTQFSELSIPVALAYFSLGLHSDYTNELEVALDYYNKTCSILKKLLPLSLSDLSKTYFNMSICYALLEDYQKAIQFCSKALDSDIKIFGNDHIDVALDYNNLGILYEYIEENDKAEIAYLECKRILTELGEKEDLDMARLIFNLGNLNWKKNDFEKSIYYLEKSLNIQKKILPENDRDMIDNYWLIGFVNNLWGRSDEAMIFLNIALELAKTNSNIQWEIYKKIYSELSETHLAQSNLPGAKNYLEKAKNTVFPDPSIIPNCTNGKKLKTWASLLVLEGDLLLANFKQEKEIDFLLKARQNYREALTLGKARRATFQGEQSKESWLTRRYSIFEKAIACDYLLAQETGEESYLHQAYEMAEQSKALLLLDALQKSKAEHFAGIPDTLLQKEKTLSANIADLEQNIFEASEGEELDSQSIALQGQLFEMQANYDSLIVLLGEKYPRYHQLQQQRKTLSIPDLQNQLRDEQAVLQYFVGDSSLFTFFINKQNVQIQKATLDFPLDQWVADWRLAVEGYGSGSDKSEAAEKYIDLSNKLYEKLLAPFADQYPTELTIIADGVLGYLPFEALLVTPPKEIGRYRSYDYFLHHHQLSYSFSTTWWQEMNASKNRSKNAGVLAIAPVFGNAPIAAADRFSGLEALNFNQKEAKAIVDSWGGKMLAGIDATEMAFCKEAADYQILHLATHAKANDESGAYSFLAFTEVPDSIENEMLYTRELYELSLQAELVVLSACETGVGELQRGEGVISLARGFSYAGAQSIVTTLWRVSDNKAAQLMTYFYEGLKQKLPKDKALQKSKIDYLASCRDRDAHPFYWAAFIPLGSMEALSPPTNRAWWTLGIGLLLLSFGGLIVKRNRPEWFKR